ncbi:hypothetical protein TNCV_1476401 [Trichonephila clavipes]|nr:hypothetical protein TNCV_1476401 [Trichonephila clavipes]
MVIAELRVECITRIFLINECRITEYFSGYIFNFVKHIRYHIIRHDADRRRAVCSPSLEKGILNVVADRPESSTTAVAHYINQVQDWIPADFVLRMPIGATAICVAAGLHRSCAEYL